MALYLPSIALMILVKKKASCETVCDTVSSFVYKPRFTRPLKNASSFYDWVIGGVFSVDIFLYQFNRVSCLLLLVVIEIFCFLIMECCVFHELFKFC